MATVINELKWQTMSAVVNEMPANNNFLKRMLYPRSVEDTLNTEDVELSVVTDSREIAPFVRKNGEAIMVAGVGSRYAKIETPNIRIKRPMTPHQYMFARQPGTRAQLLPGESQRGAVQRKIALDLRKMENMIVNAEEYLVALSLQGVISYAVADEEVFTITIPRAGANNITLSVFWDTGGASARPFKNIMTAKAIMAEIAGAEGLGITDAVCGSEAADALMELVEAGHVKMLGTDGARVAAGEMSFIEQFRDDGVIWLGRLGDVNFWRYARTATLNGVSVNMIRPKYVEFFNRNAETSGRVMYYGAIPDWDAFDSGLLQAKRFSKSWKEKDPSRMIALEHSRPLPWPTRPNATVSMKVVSG